MAEAASLVTDEQGELLDGEVLGRGARLEGNPSPIPMQGKGECAEKSSLAGSASLLFTEPAVFRGGARYHMKWRKKYKNAKQVQNKEMQWGM